MKEIYLGRQPIYDANLRLEGYELSYHPTDAESTDLLDSELSSSQMLFDTLAEVGLERLVGPGKAFLSAARELIVQGDVYKRQVQIFRLQQHIHSHIEIGVGLTVTVAGLVLKPFHPLFDDFVAKFT